VSLAARVKRGLRSAVFAALLPAAPLGRLLQGRRLVVLAYHDPAPETFAARYDAARDQGLRVALSNGVTRR
jgi:hypothetical protein